MSELNYVECFKKKGYMHSSIMFMQCALWNEEWKEKAIDRVVLSYEAMLELSGQKEGQSTLASELLNRDLELQANLVFIPIVHDLHWFLIVISREKTIYILDSSHSKSREPVICQILVTLKQLLPPDYNSEVLEVQQQKNKYASFTKTFFAACFCSSCLTLWLFFFSAMIVVFTCCYTLMDSMIKRQSRFVVLLR